MREEKGKPAPRQQSTSFRREGTRHQVEMITRERQEMRAQEQTLSQRRFSKAWNPGIESLYGTKRQTNAPVLVVDGYNVMMLALRRQRRGTTELPQPDAAPAASPTLEDLSSDSGSSSSEDEGDVGERGRTASGMTPTEFEEARSRLEERLRSYAVAVQARLVVVWDGMGYAGRPTWRAQGFDVEEREDLTVVYTATMEADTLISRAARELVVRGAYHALVVTSDMEVQAMAAAPGVFTVGSREFLQRLRDVEARMRREQREARARTEGRSLARGAGGGGGLLADVTLGNGEGGEALELQAMMLGFENAQDYLRAQDAGQTALQFYKAGRNQGRAGALGEDASRTDHDRERGRVQRVKRNVRVDGEFARLAEYLED